MVLSYADYVCWLVEIGLFHRAHWAGFLTPLKKASKKMASAHGTRESHLLVHPELCCAGDGARDPAHAELRLTLLKTVQLLARPTRDHSSCLSPRAAVSNTEAQGGETRTR